VLTRVNQRAREAVTRATAAAQEGSWDEAYRLFSEADRSGLTADALETFAEVAWWTARLDESLALRQQAYERFVAAGENRRAARGAWFLYFDYLWYKASASVASGWLQQAERLLAHEPECVEHGYLAIARVVSACEQGDLATAATEADKAAAVGRRFGDRGLTTLAIGELGGVRLSQGHAAEGWALLDEAMATVLTGRLDPLITGWVFCSLLIHCFEMADLRRAAEWTDAALAWCESLQGTTPYHGVCRTHRVELSTLRGEWDVATSEAVRATEELLTLDPTVAGEAFYVMGELHRRRGELDDAETAFVRAHQLGREPQPGLALVRLAQGRLDDAGGLLRLSPESESLLARSRILGAQVAVAVTAGDTTTAEEASRSLDELAAAAPNSVVAATAATARAMVRLAAGDMAAAGPAAGTARSLWRELKMPYEEAQARVLLARVCRAAGDEERARLEFDAARAAFERLGADLDAREVQKLLEPAAPRPGGLSAREVEVLRLVAAGNTNREIATQLVISPHTVTRHLQNIFTKLGVSSRAAAARVAVEHELV
jgi:DNA-binding CsgD family transcriptional regulator